jgi:O-antigen ligase
MSTIALIICTIFVLYMLWLDRKQSPEVSFAFWVPTIWFLLLASKPLGIWFQSGAETIEEGSPLDRTFLTIILGLGLIILAKRKFNWSNFLKDNVCLILLIIFMILSCLWANEPVISFKRWTRDLIAIVMAAVIASEPHPLKAVESLVRRSVYILIPFSYLLINYFAAYGRLYVHTSGDLMWVGAAMHKNSLTQLCIAAIFFLVWTFIRRRQGRNIAVSKYQTYLDIFILLLSFWIMGGPYHSPSYSATAAVALIIGLLMLTGFFLYKKRGTIPGPTLLTAFIIVIIIYGTITPFIGKLSLVDISSTVGRAENLTGRADVWKELVPVAMERPIHGYGYKGFWTTNAREQFEISGSHNGYLDVILELGFVGLLLFTIFFISNIRKAQRVMTQNFDWGVFWVCSLVMALVSNITESFLSTFDSRMMVVIHCLTFAFRTPIKRNSNFIKI